MQASAPNQHGGECCPYDPKGKFSWLKSTFSSVPRHLFRVHTPGSIGRTDKWHASSAQAETSASRFTSLASEDIFSCEPAQVARALDNHLRWRPDPKYPSPFVSWTSSLLVAIMYMFYRHGHGVPLDQIYLTVLDTTKCPREAFLQDLALMEAFGTFNDGLVDLMDLRSRKNNGSWYFGEFLSQGSLKIHGKSQTVTAQQLIKMGLFTLQPKFKGFLLTSEESPKWASPVLEYRKMIYQERHDPGPEQSQMRAAYRITELFDSRLGLRFLMLVHLMALLPRSSTDLAFYRNIQNAGIPDRYKGFQFLPEMNIFKHEALPETTRLIEIVTVVDQIIASQ